MFNQFWWKANQKQISLSQLGFTGALTTFLLAIANVATALEIEISPKIPELGDTISVIMTTDDPNSKPTVTIEQNNYPSFALFFILGFLHNLPFSSLQFFYSIFFVNSQILIRNLHYFFSL